MHNNKLIKVFKSFSEHEIRLFDKFVQSSIHNKHKDVIRLFQYVRKHISGQRNGLNKERIYQYLFPEEAFNVQKLHHVSSYLLKVIESFMAWQAWQKEEKQTGLFLMKAYHQHHLEKQFFRNAEKAFENIEAQSLRDNQYHFRKYQLHLEQYNYSRKLGKGQFFNLQELADEQDVAFICEKLKNACILLSHQAITKTAYETGLLKQVLDFLENHPYLEIPAVALYYYSYKALTNLEKDVYFKKLKTLQQTHQEKFTIVELHSFYTIAINYCIRKLNQGASEYWQEVFEIYKNGLAIDVFLENGSLSPRTYSNIVLSGLRLKNYEWVESFIHGYKETIPESNREGFFNYNLARFYYQQKDYQQAMPLLSQMEFTDVLNNCTAKTLLSKMYYELEEYDSLANLLQSFRTYVHRKKQLGYHRESYLNFISAVKKLMSITTFSKKEKLELKDQLSAKQKLAEKEWLILQIGV